MVRCCCCCVCCLCSVAIMSDAAHMLSDVSAFLVSIFATWAATQPSSWHYSFGYHRAEILGALVSVLAIWAVTGALVFEAVQRTINPVRVDGKREQGVWAELHRRHSSSGSMLVPGPAYCIYSPMTVTHSWCHAVPSWPCSSAPPTSPSCTAVCCACLQ